MNLPPHLLHNMKGPPKFEVGLKPIETKNWLLPDDQAHWLIGKNQLLNERMDEVFAATDAAYPLCDELAQMIAKETSFKLKQLEHPLIAASRLVSDDLLIMQKIDDKWQLVAATLCAPTFFDAKYAIGKSLELLHGPIPTGAFDLSGRIARIFDNLAPDTVLERFNWTVQWSDTRYSPNGAILREQAIKAAPNLAAEKLFERVERQTIRLLPQSKAIVFTIRIRLANLFELLKNPDEKAAFINAWQNAPQPVREYKKWACLENHIAHILSLC